MDRKELQEEKLQQVIERAKKNSYFYFSRFANIDNFIDISFMTQKDMNDKCLSMITCNINEITVRKFNNNAVRCYNKETSQAEINKWKDVFSYLEYPRKALVICRDKDDTNEFIKNALEEKNCEAVLIDHKNQLSYAARMLEEELPDVLIGEQKPLFALAQYCEKNKVKNSVKWIISLIDHKNDIIIRRILNVFKGKLIRIKHIFEADIMVGYAVEKEKGYTIWDDIYTEIISPQGHTVMNDGEYGLLSITTTEDTCQPIIRYLTDHFTRKDRYTGMLDLESHVYGQEDDINNIVYRYDGVLDWQIHNEILEIIAINQINEARLQYEIGKKWNDKYIVKYVDDYSL